MIPARVRGRRHLRRLGRTTRANPAWAPPRRPRTEATTAKAARHHRLRLPGGGAANDAKSPPAAGGEGADLATAAPEKKFPPSVGIAWATPTPIHHLPLIEIVLTIRRGRQTARPPYRRGEVLGSASFFRIREPRDDFRIVHRQMVAEAAAQEIAPLLQPTKAWRSGGRHRAGPRRAESGAVRAAARQSGRTSWAELSAMPQSSSADDVLRSLRQERISLLDRGLGCRA
jgi:hypothetical protein